MSKYDLTTLSDLEVSQIFRAEAELAECDGCKGKCQKRYSKYYKPKIFSVGGKVDFDLERCEFYKEPKTQAIAEILQTSKIIEHRRQQRQEQQQENIKAKCEANRERVLKQYKLTEIDDKTLDKILYAETQNALCENCSGFCRKFGKDAYQRYEISGGEVKLLECRFGKRQRIEKEREAWKLCFIQKKYQGKQFTDYEVTSDNNDAVKIAKWFIKTPERWLYFYGACGTGKTFLSSVIAQEFIKRGKRVVFGDVPLLMEQIKRSFGTNQDTQEIINHYINCDLLVLDDIGAGQATEWNVGVLYNIINARYGNGKPVIITSNFDLDGLESRLYVRDYKGNVIDKFSAMRIVSRLYEMCEDGFLGTNDRRRQ